MSKVSQQNSTPGVNGISVIHTQAHASGLQQVPQLVPAGPGGGGKAVPPSKQSKRAHPWIATVTSTVSAGRGTTWL